MRALSNLFYGIILILIFWLLFSWVDVLSHNDPLTGDRGYHSLNAFCVLEEWGK